MKVLLILIVTAIVLTACGSERQSSRVSALVLPLEIKHNYANQQLIFRGLKFEGHYNYDVQIGEVKAHAFFQPDKLEQGETKAETGTLLCLLPDEPRLKPGIYNIQINLNLVPVAKAQVKILDDPFEPKPTAVRGDKIFALAVFLVILVILLALIFAIRAATRKEQDQQQGQRGP